MDQTLTGYRISLRSANGKDNAVIVDTFEQMVVTVKNHLLYNWAVLGIERLVNSRESLTAAESEALRTRTGLTAPSGMLCS